MPCNISKVEYFKTTKQNRPGEAYRFLSQLALLKINLLAFTAIPVTSTETEFTVFPENPAIMKNALFIIAEFTTNYYLQLTPYDCTRSLCKR